MKFKDVKQDAHLYRVVPAADLSRYDLVHKRVAEVRENSVVLVGGEELSVGELKWWWTQKHMALSKVMGMQKYQISYLGRAVSSVLEDSDTPLGERQTEAGRLETERNARIRLKNMMKRHRRELAKGFQRKARRG